MIRIYSLILLCTAMAFGVQSCSDNDLYDEMPTAVNKFISHYYPNSALASFSETKTGYIAVIKNGPGITFNKDCFWTSINGYGSVVPQVFLFDELPPALYEYLQGTEQLDNVFIIIRDSKTYRLQLLNSTLAYDIDSGRLTGSDAKLS